MDAKQFLTEFGHIASAPGGVQRIRELILQLAISSDLSERSVNDAPAKDLLEANRAEQLEFVAQGRLKRQSPLRPIERVELPWNLPSSWMWCRLGDLTNYGQSPKVEFRDVTNDTWVLELEDIEKGTSRLVQRVRARERRFQSTKNAFPKGAVLYGKLRPYLDKVLIADEDGVCTTEIAAISFFHGIEAAYLRWYLKSPFFVRYASSSTHGMNLPRLGTDVARGALFPMPPLPEQKRIVAKVNELMALCDKLEDQQQQMKSNRRITLGVVLSAFTRSDSVPELTTSWERLKRTMHLLASDGDDVGRLETSLLDLALRGWLNARVSEVPKDTVARMRARNTELASKKIRHSSVVDFAGVHELRVRIPESWTWCRLNDVASVVRGGSPRPAGDPRFYGGEIPFLKVADITRSSGMFVEGFSSTIKPAGLSKTREIVGRTVLLTNSGATLGVPAICDFRTTFNDGIAAFIELSEEVFDEYLFFYLRAKTKWLREIASRGQGQPNLNTDIIRAMWFPLPPLVEQKAIVAAAHQRLKLCRQLLQQREQACTTVSALADASVSFITGISREVTEYMKLPKTELVSSLRLGSIPNVKEDAPLTAIVAKNNGEVSAKALWGSSGLEIDAFYQQLKAEMSRGWIVQPEPAYVKEVEAN